MKYQRREGFSLLEILLATTILLAAIAVLGQLAQLGLRNAAEASKLARARQLCQNKLEAIVLGIDAAESIKDTPLKEAPDWLYTVALEPIDRDGMVAVRVSVKEDLPEQSRSVEFSLVRWLPTEPMAPEAPGGSAIESTLTP